MNNCAYYNNEFTLDVLEEHFSEKFSYNSEKESDKMNNCAYYNNEFTLSLYALKKHMKSLSWVVRQE